MFPLQPRKIWNDFVAYIKNHKVVLFLFLFVTLAFLWEAWTIRRQLNETSESSQEVIEQTNIDIAKIRLEYGNQMQAQEEINTRQTEELTRLTSDYAARISLLESRLRTRRTTFIEETNGDSQEMASRLTKRLGWSRPAPVNVGN